MFTTQNPFNEKDVKEKTKQTKGTPKKRMNKKNKLKMNLKKRYTTKIKYSLNDLPLLYGPCGLYVVLTVHTELEQQRFIFNKHNNKQVILNIR
jgi:malic enzyme